MGALGFKQGCLLRPRAEVIGPYPLGAVEIGILSLLFGGKHSIPSHQQMVPEHLAILPNRRPGRDAVAGANRAQFRHDPEFVVGAWSLKPALEGRLCKGKIVLKLFGQIAFAVGDRDLAMMPVEGPAVKKVSVLD